MKINFGKYSGYTVKEVALCDSDYATWAANNLRNQAMREAFAQALKDAKNASAAEMAEAHVSKDSIHYNKVVAMMEADKTAEANAKAAKAEIVNRYAKLMNVPAKTLIQKIQSVWMRDIESISLMPFSSEDVRKNFVSMMEELHNVKEW
jgi:hypothetical protein